MGYTSYWRGNRCNEQDEKGYHRALPLIQKILERYKDILCRDYDAPTLPPVADEGQIHFNGKEDDGHETFVFTPHTPKFAFCKTAEKPYDVVVCECLLVLKAHMPNLDVSSDGFCGSLKDIDESDPVLDGKWMTALANVRKHFSIHYEVKITRRRPPYYDAEPVLVTPEAAADADDVNVCQNCGWEGPTTDLREHLSEGPIPDIFERVAPGEPMPSGECPECGSLCHPKERGLTKDELHELLSSCEEMIAYVLEDGYHYEGGADILSKLRTTLKKETVGGRL